RRRYTGSTLVGWCHTLLPSLCFVPARLSSSQYDFGYRSRKSLDMFQPLPGTLPLLAPRALQVHSKVMKGEECLRIIRFDFKIFSLKLRSGELRSARTRQFRWSLFRRRDFTC
ncbi:uncharacterized protein A1O5_01476, partial [Cladophialophora psammophila CBS 110553]